MLGYEASNLLIRYPLLDNVQEINTPYIPDNVFVDIQFVDRTNTIYRVYISRITCNTGSSTITFYFSNVITTTLICSLVVPFTLAVDHIGNLSSSNVNATNGSYTLKISFGTGITDFIAASFDTNYEAIETELSPSCVVLYHPKLEQVVISNNYPVTTVKTYTDGEFIILDAGTNIDVKDASNGPSLAVFPRAGTGLYDACHSGDITEVITVNGVGPDAEGSLFLTTDTCYSQNILNETDLTTYSAYLDVYEPFIIPYASNVNIATPGHSIIIQNNCSPKCAPEYLNALAYYENRLRDAMQELYLQVVQPYTTAGTTVPTATATTLTASSFTSVWPGKSGFIKYFHEGRNLIVNYNAALSQTVEIISVLSTSQVLVSPALSTTAGSPVGFIVQDEGLYNSLNGAIVTYNSTIGAAINNPYAQIIYTTTEGLNSLGAAGTFLSVVVSIYNPSSSSISFSISLSPSSNVILVPNTIKLRQNGTVTLNVTSGTLACKTQASVEAIYFTYCGPLSGNLEINTTAAGNNVPTGTQTIDVTSLTCAGSGGAAVTTAFHGVAFTYDFSGTGTLDVISSSLPSWASVENATVPPPSGHNIIGTPTDTINTSYLIYANIATGTGSIQSDLIINVFAPPVLTVTTLYAGVFDLFIDKVFSTPMSGHLSSTNFPTGYTATGLPSGINIDTSTGVITGTASVTGTYSVSLTVTNSAGSDTKSFDIEVSATTPVINSGTSVTFLQGISASYQITATNNPTSFSTDTLPTGLYVSADTGLIYGIPTVPQIGTALNIYATNTSGTGAESLTIAITAQAPVIVSSSTATGYVGSTFTYNIVGSNSPTSYNATGLPSWATVNTSTGVISGTPTTAGSTSVAISATNVTGTGGATLLITV